MRPIRFALAAAFVTLAPPVKPCTTATAACEQWVTLGG